ncbi:MAG: hypothetical protein QNJ13_12310 [Paracoccaceae bacterium]|nr:hypothetical protein [Paracoccaceae bacterium]
MIQILRGAALVAALGLGGGTAAVAGPFGCAPGPFGAIQGCDAGPGFGPGKVLRDRGGPPFANRGGFDRRGGFDDIARRGGRDDWRGGFDGGDVRDRFDRDDARDRFDGGDFRDRADRDRARDRFDDRDRFDVANDDRRGEFGGFDRFRR